MGEFLDERIGIEIRYDNTYTKKYAVNIVESGGTEQFKPKEFRQLLYPYPRGQWHIAYQLDRDEMYDKVIGLYDRVFGKYAGFRAKCFDDFSTAADHRSAPSAFDQPLKEIDPLYGYELQKIYGNDKVGLAVGYPVRTIFAPVVSTIVIGVNGVPRSPSDYTWDPVTRRIYFDQGFSLNTGDIVTGGCEFDIPVRFESDLQTIWNHQTSRYVEVDLIELITL